MRVVVCGDRNTTDEAYVFRALDAFHARTPITLLIEGGQRLWSRRLKRYIGGIDFLAHRWAIERHIPTESRPADWNTFGPSAGPKRNRDMLDIDKPDAVIAFPGGRGTTNMMTETRKRGVPLWMIREGGASITREEA